MEPISKTQRKWAQRINAERAFNIENKMSDNPLIQALKEVCLFLDDSKIEYMPVGV